MRSYKKKLNELIEMLKPDPIVNIEIIWKS